MSTLMNNKLTYLLDTSAAIAMLNQKTEITPIIENADAIYASSITIGEFFYGAENSGRVKENLERIEQFVKLYKWLVCDIDTARFYGRIYHQLKVIGRPISPNDVWIAAIAMQYDLTLLTRDTDFNSVENLKVMSW